MKTENQSLPPQLQLACADAATTAAILAHQDAQNSQEQARASRRSHQQDHVAKLKQAAGKLKEMAGNTLASGIFQGVMGMGSAALSCSATFCGDKVAGRLRSGAKANDALAKADPFAVQKDYQGADKAEIEAEAAKESALAQEAGDAASAHQRVQGTMIQQLQKTLDAQNAARQAAIKL